MPEINVTHTFVSGKSAASDATLVDGPNWDDVHVLTNPRLLFSDTCSSSSTPAGVNTTGDALAFDSTRLRRELGGTQASTYVTPSFPLNGPVFIEVVHENINAYTTGNFGVEMIRDTGAATIALAGYQNDGNLVATVGATAVSVSGTTTAATTYVRDDSENMHRSVVGANEQKLAMVAMGQHPMAADYGPTSQNSGRRGQSGARFVYSGTLNAGDNVSFKLTTSSTRKAGIYLVRVWRGAIAPL